MFDLTGQTAIVTGAATGLGEAIARRFAASGASVAVADRDLAGAQAVAESLKTFAVGVDITDAASVRGAVADVLSKTGRIDILVNNAGVAGKAAPIWEQSEEDWAFVLAVNLNGVFNFCKAVLPHMRERKYGTDCQHCLDCR